MSERHVPDLAAEADEIGRKFFGRANPGLSRELLFIAKLAQKHEALASGAPLRSDTRERLERAAALADELAEVLSAAPLDRLNGLNGFRAAARNAGGDGAETATPETLRATAAGARALLSRIAGGQGPSRISDALGNPRGRLICAVAAVVLIERQTGAPPGKTNPAAQALARRLWHLAGGRDSDAVDDGGDELAAWERHIRAARGQDRSVPDALIEQARALVACAADAWADGDGKSA